MLRRKLVGWLRAAEQAELDGVLDGVVRCSATSGQLLPTADEVPNLWAYIAGDANAGRFTQFAIKAAPNKEGGEGAAVEGGGLAPQNPPPHPDQAAEEARKVGAADDAAPDELLAARGAAEAAAAAARGVPTVRDGGALNIVVDVMVMQMTLRASHPQALPDGVAKMGDVLDVFGKVPMQASLVERCEHRETYSLVGRAHELGYWPSGDDRMPKLESFRSYYAQVMIPPPTLRALWPFGCFCPSP